MKITHINPGNGRDLYGSMVCEHCDAVSNLSGGYNDGHWHNNVLPAFHCEACGKKRSGELLTPAVTERNVANGVNGI